MEEETKIAAKQDSNGPMITYMSFRPFASVKGKFKKTFFENRKIILKRVGEYSLALCYIGSLSEIIISAHVKEIPKGCFASCLSLREVSFIKGSVLEKICKMAFIFCTNLKMIDFPPTLKIIEEQAFLECLRLRNADLSATQVEFVGEHAFNTNTSIVLPKTLKTLGFLPCKMKFADGNQIYVHDGCYINNLNRIICCCCQGHIMIREGVKKIFSCCYQYIRLVRIFIPSSVTQICSRAFSFCVTLEKIRFDQDSQLKVIENYAFEECCSLRSIKFPKSLKSIEESAFSFSALRSVIFPNDSQLEEIYSPFNETFITKLELPSSLKIIDSIFQGMYALESVTISNELFESEETNKVIYSKDGSQLIAAIPSIGEFIIPQNVKIIKKGALYYSGIKQIVIPSSVETIEDESIFCKKVIFEEGTKIKYIHPRAFHGLEKLIIDCPKYKTRENGVVIANNPKGIVFVPRSLHSIEIDPDVEEIHSEAFYYTKIEKISFPSSLKRIYRTSIVGHYEEVEFSEGTELEFIENGAIYLFGSSSKVYIPKVIHYGIDGINIENPKEISLSEDFYPDIIMFGKDKYHEFDIEYHPSSPMESQTLLRIFKFPFISKI